MRLAAGVDLPPGLDACRAWLDYEGDVRHLIGGIKYRNDRRALSWLADGVAGVLSPPPGAVVTWAPTTAGRRRRRGFDQAELLARAVSRRWGVPCRRLLVRRSGMAQTGRSRRERLDAPALTAVGIRHLRRPVIVVDDVLTTGATLAAAATALRGSGASWVAAVVAARTP